MAEWDIPNWISLVVEIGVAIFAIVISLNFYKRGIGNLGNRQIEHLDTIEKDGNLYQIMKILRVNRLRTAILSDPIVGIGKFKTVERLVNLNADRKRMWFEELRDVNDEKRIDSMPISMNFVSKNKI
ncbi:MAG: hypothetical protein OEW78_05800 [Nitrosopumilus sp.]|uniref:hypothetical protein n=1 Tax=Nitrosopumilus sp. TaxID=2024843 RepID=UPI00246C52DE|nr:hypothetical protein [Nitrosopumilus sp.]MDH5431379.1 hypothetical protein [Nitrosopumilus sp.]